MQRRAALCSMALVMLATIFVAPVRSDESVVVVHDVEYATLDGIRLALDVYRPIEDGPHPAVVAIHGGGWRGGDKSQWQPSATALVTAGFVVFAIDYRLAPPGGTARFGDALRDVRRALDWVQGHGPAYGADPQGVALLGSSAGAHLALMAGQREGSTGVRAVAAWSPPVDLIPLARWEAFRGPLRAFIGCSLRHCRDRYRRMSPFRHVEASDPRTFLAGSTDELLPLEQLRSMTRRLDDAGVSNVHAIFPGSAHGQQLRPLVLDDTIAFLGEGLTRK